MSDKVVALRGTIQGEPVPDVVEMLEDLLRRAKDGHVRAIAYAVVNVDGTVGTAWAKPDEGGSAGRSIENHGLGSGILTLASRYGGACE